jgi:hypothetical protein
MNRIQNITTMKTKINTMPGAVLLLLVLTLTANAATGPCATTPTTQVYDLKADWSDTQNPNGPWSYRLEPDGGLLLSDPFPWVAFNDNPGGGLVGIARTTEALVVPGSLELGDIFVFPGYGVSWWLPTPRWTAPANGRIDISGTAWLCVDSWTLTHNGNVLSSGEFVGGDRTRDLPYNLSSGSGGATALQNIAVQAGDRVEIAFWKWISCGDERIGLNFAITLTTDSNASFAEDAIIWHQPLARNGASEDTDPSASRTVKYRFKRGSTIPIQIHALGCDGADVTANANVIGTVTVFGDSNCDGAADANAEPIEFNGVGGGGGVMDKIGGHLKYNLDTQSLPTTTQCYILRVTVTDTSTGEEKFEEVLLQAK